MRAFVTQYGLLIAAGLVFLGVLVREIRRGRELRATRDRLRGALLAQPITDEQVRRITRRVMDDVNQWEAKRRASEAKRSARLVVRRDLRS